MSHIHIDVNDVSFAYDNSRCVLENISLHVGEHESVGVIGANGAGKSTLLKLLVGLCMPATGEIRIEEVPVRKDTLSIIREKIGYVFQDSDSQLFMSTVREDVAFAPVNYGLPEDEVARRVDNALAMVNATHLADRPVYKLSGGEKKLVSIATILSMTPDIILMDEPTIALDPRNRRNLISVLNSFEHLKIIASHDLDFVRQVCSRVIFVSDGRIIYDGNPQDILDNEEYLVQNGL